MTASVCEAELQGLHVLRRVNLDEIMDLLDSCPIRTLSPGEILLGIGQSNQTLYMVLAGRMSVHLETPAHPPIGHVEAGQTVGEISVIDDSAASAHVIASDETRLLCVNEETFWSLVRRSHEFSQNLLMLLAQRLRANTSTITRAEERRRVSEHEAMVDGLTGIHNRRWLDNALPRVVRRCADDDVPISLLMLDIDHFKRFNDQHGHAAGDAVLVKVARLLVDSLRTTDLPARYGGEEFVCLLPNTSNPSARQIAERTRAVIGETAMTIGSQSIGPVTVSIGVATLEASDDVASLIGRADACLYRAKDAGRNRVEG